MITLDDKVNIRNAVIVSIDFVVVNNMLAGEVCVDYGGEAQCFGDYAFSQFVECENKQVGNPYMGEFIFSLLEVAGVQRMSDVKGRCVRLKLAGEKVVAIGHVIKDIWHNLK